MKIIYALAFALFASITSASLSYAETHPTKVYWSCVTNLEKVTDEEFEAAKAKAMSTPNSRDAKLQMYVDGITAVSIKACAQEREVALKSRMREKNESKEAANANLSKVDKLAPDMIKTNIGQTLLIMANPEHLPEKR